MVLLAPSGACTAPCGDQVYFDGGGSACAPSCPPTPVPTLFGLRDVTATLGYTYSTLFNPPVDFTGLTPPEAGACSTPSGPTYYGMQAAPVLETPEGGGADPHPHNSVWAHAACGATLYRFDAQSGAQWTGGGASTISITGVTGLNGYVAGSTMQTVNDATTGDTVAFQGVNHDPETKDSFVLALDLETGDLLWSKEGPITQYAQDSPFHGQFPIAKTAAGGYVLIAAQAGAYSGAGSILGIPLW